MNLFVDDSRPKPEGWTIVRSYTDAKLYLAPCPIPGCRMCLHPLVENLSLDHDMGKDGINGTDFVRWMVETGNWPKNKPVVHSDNPDGSKRMRDLIDRFFGQPALGPMF